jgi:1-acyl-sn-glycerol-3-phosphate acyltransferase
MVAFVWSILVRLPLVFLCTILYGAVGACASFFDSDGRKQAAVARAWARLLIAFSGARVSVEGLERIDPGGTYVFASNHLSYMDTPVVLSRIPVQFRFLAKQGLFLVPFLGGHLKRAGHIPVPREDPRESVKTMKRAAEIIRSRGVSILIFPEGGRSEDGTLQEFKDGAAYIAITAQAPLVPVALKGTHEVLPMGSAVFRPGPVRMRIGEPIPTLGLKLPQRHTLSRQSREAIAAMLEDSAR